MTSISLLVKSARTLSQRGQELLRNGADPSATSETPAPVRAAMAVCTDAVERGLSLEEVQTCFSEGALAEQLHQQWGPRFGRKLEKSYAKALRRAATRDADLTTRLDSISSWPRGKAGSTARAVYAALAEIERRTGKHTFAASERELSELSRISTRNAIRRALGTLQAMGLLRPALLSDGEKGWQLTEVSATRPILLQPHVDARESGRGSAHSREELAQHTADSRDLQAQRPLRTRSCSPVLHDLWSYAGLGPNAQRVFAYLARTPATVAQLVNELGLSRSGLSKNDPIKRGLLQRMADVGIISKHGRSWAAIDGVDLDQVAADMGVLGRRKQLAHRHAQERDLWAQYKECSAAPGAALCGLPPSRLLVQLYSGEWGLVDPETAEILPISARHQQILDSGDPGWILESRSAGQSVADSAISRSKALGVQEHSRGQRNPSDAQNATQRTAA